MALLYAHELVDRLERLFADLSNMATAAVLGFIAEPLELGEAGIAAVAKMPGWVFADLRQSRGVDLTALAGRDKVVIATTANGITPQLAHWLNGIVDGHRPAGSITQTVIVLCDGAASYEALPKELKRLAYSDFIP